MINCSTHRSYSILDAAILELINICEEEKDRVRESFEGLKFCDLDLPSEEFDRLYWSSVFQDDTLDNILSFSVGYIHNLWNEEAKFNEIIDKVLSLIGDVLGYAAVLHVSHVVSDKPIFNNIEIGEISALIISPTFVPERIVESLFKHKIYRWGDAASTSEKEIIERLGFSVAAVEIMDCLWHLRHLFKDLQPLLSSAGAGSSFESMIHNWILQREKKDKYARILMQRLGWAGNDEMTLERVAEINGITRERVRQIEELLSASLSKKKSLRALYPFWFVVDSYLHLSNGIVSVSELCLVLKEYYRWENEPSESGLRNLVHFCPEGVLNKSYCGQGFIVAGKSLCHECTFISEHLLRSVHTATTIDVMDALDILKVYCKAQCPQSKMPFYEFSKSFIDFKLNMDQNLSSKVQKRGPKLHYRDDWQLHYGRITDAAEVVLKNHGREMHFTEVSAELRKIRQCDKNILDRNVLAALDRSLNALLWKRGTYIHRENATFPYGLIRNVEKWLYKKLRGNIPFVSAYGAFKQFQESCIHEGISSEYALYSCLKMSNEPLFSFPRFPFVYLSKVNAERIPMPLVIEEFIREAGGPVKISELRKFAVDGINIKEFMLTQSLDRAPNIIRSGRSTYLHTDCLNIDKRKISDILAYTNTFLSKEGHVSAQKIFNDKRVDCKLMGIDSPEALYSVLKMYASTKINVYKYPKILPFSENGEGERGIIKEILLYIENKKAPCPVQELYEHFVEKLGYSENTIYWATYNEDVFQYLRGCLVHRDVIGWTKEKEGHLEEIAFDIYNQFVTAGRCYGLIDILLEDELPLLENDIYWTNSLIVALLRYENNFIVIGNSNNVYLPLPNVFAIENFEDLVFQILKNDYDGVANVKIFNEDLNELGLISKEITRGMLGKMEKVVMAGQEIMLRELANHA